MLLDRIILSIVKAGSQINICDSLIRVELRVDYTQKCPICYREMGTVIITSVTGNRIVLQRPRLLLYTDVGDAIFLLADLQRRGFHDEGH